MCDDDKRNGTARRGFLRRIRKPRAPASQSTAAGRRSADVPSNLSGRGSSQQGAYLTTRRDLAEEELRRLDESKMRLEYCISLLTGLTGAEKRTRAIRSLIADLADEHEESFPQDRQGKLSEEVGSIRGHIRAIREALGSGELKSLDQADVAQDRSAEAYGEIFRKAGEDLSGASRRISEAKDEGTQVCLGDIRLGINAIAQTVPELYPVAENWTDKTLLELHDALGRIRWGLGLDRSHLKDAAGSRSQTEFTQRKPSEISRTKNVGPI